MFVSDFSTFLALSVIKNVSPTEDNSHFQHVMTADRFKMLQRVMEKVGAASLRRESDAETDSLEE